MNIAWGARVSSAFIDRMLRICDTFGWHWPDAPSDLMACMAFETGRTFSPSVRNGAGSGAVGLIQFMPSTAMVLGTTTDALAALSAVDQLGYVERYFEPYAPRVANLPDMYMAILLPRYVGAPSDAVLFWKGAAYRQNAGLDRDHDGKITKAEATSLVAATKATGLQPANVLSRAP